MSQFTLPKPAFLAYLFGLCLQMTGQGLWAQEPEQPPEAAVELDPLVVVASKLPRPLSTVAAQVTVIDATDIVNGMAEDLEGVLKYEPGLDVESDGTRFGSTGINIRGIGGNRVVMEQDGIPLRDRFAVGAFSNGGRGLVETDRIKRIEVLHGPASALYGSNALGGVVSITTWDPGDLLARGQGAARVKLRAGYHGANESQVQSALTAVAAGAHGLLAAATYRQGHELDNHAPAGIPGDPQDWDSRDVMVRYTYDTDGGNRLRITALGQQRDADTRMQSQLGYGRRFRTTTELSGADHDQNRRFSMDYDFSWAGWRQATLQVFTANYKTRQSTLETRGAAQIPVRLERQFYYRQQHDGFDLNLFRQEGRGAARHRIGLGLKWLRTESTERRDGLQISLLDGSTSKELLGEPLPVRDFPNSRSRELGLFVQDEITFPGGRWELSPALRWDSTKLNPSRDTLWVQSFPDVEVVAVSRDEFTPRVGLLFRARDHLSVYAQFARGFRAPSFEDVNIGLDLPLLGYRAIPNPDLKSETSGGFEVGVRRLTRASRFSLALFHTDYDHFIETRALIGRDPITGDLIFQSRNIDQARIYGADLRYDQDLEQWGGILRGWKLNLAAYWSRGENRESGEPLNSVSPPQAVAGLEWDSAEADWNIAATVTLTAAKRQKDIDRTGGERFRSGAWSTVDFTVGWRYRRCLELHAGVFNIADTTYWRWADVARREAGDPMIPILSRPGRSWSLTARLSF